VRSLVGELLRVRNQAAPPVPYSAPGRYGGASSLLGATGDETYMRAYGTNGTVFAIVSLLASTVAQPEWRLYRKPARDGRVRYTTGDQGSDQRIEVLQHHALDVWNEPNDFMTGFEFREIFMQHLELTGKGIWLIGRDPRATFPMSMWPVRPDRMTPLPSAEKFLGGWVYSGPSGEKVPLEANEVIQIRYPNPLDVYGGLGPVQSVLVDIDAARYAAEWNRGYFRNSATPGGVITVPNHLNDTEWDEFNDRWRESHQGVNRAHRVAILEYGAQWVATESSLKDMDFAGLRNVSRDVLREAWGLHKSMLGNADDVNRANAETAEQVFGRWKALPRLDRIRMVGNARFLPLFGTTGQGVELDYVNPLPDDREADNQELVAKATAAQLLLELDIFDPHDVLEICGLPDIKTVEKLAQPPPPQQPQPPPGAPTPDPAEGEQVENRIRPAITVRSATPSGMPEHDLSAVDRQWQTATDQTAAQYQRQIAPAQRQQAVDAVRNAVAAGNLAALGALVLNHAAAAELITAAMVALAATAAAQAAKEAQAQGADVQPVPPSSSQLRDVAEVTAALMAAELAVAAARHALHAYGPDKAAQQVADEVEAFLKELSDTGPRGHIAAALTVAQNKARAETITAGPECEIYATEQMDRNTCRPCKEINGHLIGSSTQPEIQALIEAYYPGGGYVGCLGGERCRGTVIGVYPARTAQDSLPALIGLLKDVPGRVNGHDHKVGAR